MLILFSTKKSYLNMQTVLNQSLCRSGQALRVRAGCYSQISGQPVHECVKLTSPKYRTPLPPGNIPNTHFC